MVAVVVCSLVISGGVIAFGLWYLLRDPIPANVLQLHPVRPEVLGTGHSSILIWGLTILASFAVVVAVLLTQYVRRKRWEMFLEQFDSKSSSPEAKEQTL